LQEIIEVLYYKENDSELFAGYVNMWLKIKQEASGWPTWCKTDEEKEQYLSQYYEHENIELDKEKIEKNPALRFIAKIMLNSFWGKLAQRPNLTKTEMVESYDRYWHLACNEDIEITGELMVNDDVMLVTYKYAKDEKATVLNYNVAIASYVTAYARLELYRVIEQLEKIREHSVLYFDTDSVIYFRHKNDIQITCGDYLGELTDEIVKDYGEKAKCIGFASLGPKNYSYEIRKEDGSIVTPIKTKGVKLTVKALEKITFEKMVDMAIRYSNSDKKHLQNKRSRDGAELIPQLQIHTNKHHQIFTRYFEKIYRAVSTKRCINANLTLPYGY
jgi:hypothetical protein